MITLRSESAMLDFGRQLARELLSQLVADQQSDHAQAADSHDDEATNHPSSIVLEFVGDVGSGKTTITRGLAAGLGITEPVTSPSFTISKQYAFDLPASARRDPAHSVTPHPSGLLIHYDFYRLPDPGLMSEDLAESIATPHAITVVEWAESVTGILPADRCIFYITINDDGSRTITAKSPSANQILSTIATSDSLPDAKPPERKS